MVLTAYMVNTERIYMQMGSLELFSVTPLRLCAEQKELAANTLKRKVPKMIIDFEDRKEAAEWDKFDKILTQLIPIIEQEESRCSVLNAKRLNSMYKTRDILYSLFEEDDVSIECHYNEPFKSMGYISVVGEDFTVYDMKRFYEAVAYADNIDIYPLTNGNVKIDITFHGLMI